MMKRTLCLLLCFAMLLACCPSFGEAAAVQEKTAPWTLEEKALPMYIEGFGMVHTGVPVYYANGVNDLPYVDLMEWAILMDLLMMEEGSDNHFYTAELDEKEKQVLLTYKPTASNALISFDESVVLFENYDTFGTVRPDALDIVSLTGFNELTGQQELVARVVDLRNERKGESKVIPLDSYQIPMTFQDGKCLMPLHTVFDLFFCIQRNYVCCCNNEAIFLGGKGMFVQSENADPMELSELGELYYKAPKTERSAQLALFGFYELCMEMDCFYGLKDSHNIHDFLELMVQTEYYERLLSPDPAVADACLRDFINFYFDDLHSSYKFPSWMTGFETELPEEKNGISARRDTKVSRAYHSALEPFAPDGLPAYQEIGNTAYVTFNGFVANHPSSYYYDLDLSSEDCITDTISLVLYAHHQITRENSPVENVVLDLSLNGGGDADAAVFVISWFLGEAAVANVDTFTGAQVSGTYLADTNLDREFSEEDWLIYRYQLYCLISPYSFSCANLVPWAFKSDGAVTLVGRTSGGGSCLVQSMATAWGTIFQMSGANRLAYVKNGSFYDVDRGVEPDIVLTKLSSFFDREKLTNIINNAY